MKGQTATHLRALSDAAAILRDVGDTVGAQSLDQRAHMLLKAHRSVSDSARLFWTARSIERDENERREQEAAKREDDRKKELDSMYRLAKEETAAKRAVAGGAAAEARKKNWTSRSSEEKRRPWSIGRKLILRICSSIWLQTWWRQLGPFCRTKRGASVGQRRSEPWLRRPAARSVGWLPVEKCWTLHGTAVCAPAACLPLHPWGW